MSQGDWRHYPHVGVILFALIALGGVRLLDEYQSNCRYGDNAAQQQLACGGYNALPIVAPEPNPNPGREEWRREKDLQAQREMALWAMVMAGISGAGLIVTAIGIVLVWKTLNANRAAVGAAYDAIENEREIGEAQTRAYLSVRSLHIGFNERREPALRIEFENFGQSPALRAEYSVTAFYHRKKRKTKTLSQDDASPLGHIGAGQTRTNQLVFTDLMAPKTFRKCLFSSGFSKNSVGIAIATSFYDVFGNHFFLKSGFTIRAYGFKPNGKLVEMEAFGDEDAEVCPNCQAEHNFQSFFPSGHD